MKQRSKFSKQVKKQTLAEQVAEAVQESILAGEWEGGEPLPPEPELAELFGVSRAVVRDATRMLVAKGLVVAEHGRGVFVTESQVTAFGQALLLALRRAGASVWDVERFEQVLIPEVCALAAAEATDEELEMIAGLVEAYVEEYAAAMTAATEGTELPEADRDQIRAGYRALYQAIFAATHNQVLELLAQPLLSLRNVREWQGLDDSPADVIESESAYVRTMLAAITSRDPVQARETVARLMALPVEAEQAMRETPVGEAPKIPLGLSQVSAHAVHGAK